MEYSGYVDRGTVTAAPTVDWSGIIQNTIKTLDTQEANREAIRVKQAKDTQTALEEINKVNTGQSQTGNEYITKASYQAKTLLNDAYKEYTNGRMSREMFNIIKQNTLSAFNDINSTMKGLQDDYTKYQELSQKGELSAYSDYMQGVKGKLADLSNKTLYFNPTDGKGYIATVKEDGSIDKETLMQTNWMKNNANFFDPRVKVEEEVGKFTGKIADFQKLMARTSRGVWTVEDATQRPEFNKMASDITTAVASTPLRMASVLTDFVDDKNYTYTQSKAEADADPTKIYIKADANGRFIPQLTEAQIKDGEDAIKRVITSQLKYKETQVEDTYHPHVYAPKGGNGGKKEEIKVTTNDVKPTTSMARGGKFVDSQKFTLKNPVVYDATGVKQSLKAIIINPKTGHMDIEIETPATVKSGSSTITTVNKATLSTVRGGVNKDLTDPSDKSKLKNPDIGAIDNIVSKIWDPTKNNGQGGYLENWQELYNQKIDEAINMYNKSHPKNPLKRRNKSQTSTTNTQDSEGGVSLNANNWGK